MFIVFSLKNAIFAAVIATKKQIAYGIKGLLRPQHTTAFALFEDILNLRQIDITIRKISKSLTQVWVILHYYRWLWESKPENADCDSLE